MMRFVSLLFIVAICQTPVAADDTLSLAGAWRFQLDRADTGIDEQWFARTLPDKIQLPGGLTEQGVGDAVTPDTRWTGGIVDRSWFTAPEYEPYRQPGNVKIPFWLQPERYYAGAAWFQRDVEIPSHWSGRRFTLYLERAHWETRLWVDGKFVGSNTALATPHEYDLGQLTPSKHTLTLRIDNRLIVDVGENSHSISDHTQGNWNGIVGEVELRATQPVWIAHVRVDPDLSGQSLRVRVEIGNCTPSTASGELELDVVPLGRQDDSLVRGLRIPFTSEPGRTTKEIVCDLASAPKLWDEFNPTLYTALVKLGAQYSGNTASHQKSTVFGFRRISVDGTQFTINDRKLFLRGTLECAIFPRTGHPPTDPAAWARILQVCKDHGLNHIRFHSWCPPEAAFSAADGLGIYLYVEASSWANQSTTLGDGKPVDRWIYEETERILRYYGNHPSFILMAYGNEPGGPRHTEYLAKWLQHFRAYDSRRLYTGAAGWPELAENQFHLVPQPRIQGWGEELSSRINAKPPETMTDYRDFISRRDVPIISHEIGQWCVYPNFDEIPKYTGYLKPRNFEIFHERLQASGMGALAKPFLLASGKLQALCYKEDIEAALRTPGMGGFHLLDLHDFPGQGTALVGVLDPFWEEKGYITPAEYHRLCIATVPLARMPKRVFTTGERLEAQVEMAHFGPASIIDGVVEWKLTGTAGRILCQGSFPAQAIQVGHTRIGTVSADLTSVPAPQQCKLVVTVRDTTFENDWDLWVYPSQMPDDSTKDVLVTRQFDDTARQRLRSGGSVLLTIPGKQLRNFDTAPVKLGFSSVFWNTAWTSRQAPTTLGILCDPKHSALALFPTDYHSNWQWWYLVHRAGALRLDVLPAGIEPIVRIIDDWFTSRPLGLIVEGKVGAGKIVVCGFDLTRDADDPVSRQMKASLMSYLTSRDCSPTTELTFEQITALVVERKGVADVRAVKANSQQSGYDAENVVDGDPGTIWHTGWGDAETGFPHELIVELESPQEVAGIITLPRQDGNRNGWIKGYEVYIGLDGQDWGKPVVQGEFSSDASVKTIRFPTPVAARFIKLRALSGHANGPWASLAELELLPAGRK